MEATATGEVESDIRDSVLVEEEKNKTKTIEHETPGKTDATPPSSSVCSAKCFMFY